MIASNGIRSPANTGVIRFDHRRYSTARPMRTHWCRIAHRSPSARYAQLIDDIRNDITRLPQFFETAARVLDIDQKRQKSLAYVSALSPAERDNAERRMRENASIVAGARKAGPQRVVILSFRARAPGHHDAVARRRSKSSARSINCKRRSSAIARCRRPGCASRAWLRRAALTYLRQARLVLLRRIARRRWRFAPSASIPAPAPAPGSRSDR